MSQLAGLNIFDIVVIALILLLSIRGLLEGFTKEFFSAIGLIGGVFVASYFHKMVATYLHDNFLSSLSIKLLNIISLVLIFVVFFYLIKLISKGVQLIGNDETISATSRLGGMIVKMLKLFFVFSLIVYAFSTKPQVTEKFKDTLSSSKVFPLLKNTGAAILGMPIISNISTNSSSSSVDNNDSSNSAIVTDNNSSEATDKNTTTTKEEASKAEVKSENNSSKEAQEELNTTKEQNNTTAPASNEENSTTEEKTSQEVLPSSDKNDTNSESNSTNIETNTTK